jgi:hypothetical protein
MMSAHPLIRPNLNTRPAALKGDVTNAFFVAPEGWTVGVDVRELGASFLLLMGKLTDDDLNSRLGEAEASVMRYLEDEMRKTQVAKYNIETGEYN